MSFTSWAVKNVVLNQRQVRLFCLLTWFALLFL
jgi:hypothetical protein